MTTHDTTLLDQWMGKTVFVAFHPGYVALSYVVSLIGAGSTLELINRRTSLKGWHNHALLVGAAISMGGIAIWSMHFVGNRAITIGNGEPELQISYSVAITVASFFVPIFVLLLAFVAVGTQDECQWWRVGLAGSLSGGAICGMHYLGDKAISNYQCSYVIGNVVGAALIAVSASTVALSLFFIFKAAWTNSWRRRAGCTVVLAGAVSGMHWCAASGTRYTLVQAPSAGLSDNSRDTTVIAVMCLSLAASAIMIGTAIISARTMKGYATKAQQIVLAVAVFDNQGRILVSPDGLLPSEKITETFPQRTIDDVFSAAHPLFHWMYRASRNWSGISALLGWMNTHLDHISHDRREARSGIKLIEENGQLIENYDVIFRELFCIAAATLATRMTENILNMGVLWDEIFATGIETRQPTRLSGTLDGMLGLRRRQNTAYEQDDILEKGHGHRYAEWGRGSLMFLVRHVETVADIERLEAAGFRFAKTNQVSGIIRSSMQIKTRRLEEKLQDMATYSERLQRAEPGVHIGLFAVRARMDKYGFDVLVNRGGRNMLPTVRLPFYRLDKWHKEFLKNIDGLPIPVLLTRLAFTAIASGWDKQELQFAEQLRHAVSTLQREVDDSALDGATLSSEVVDMPCRPLDDSHSHTCQFISLQIVLDINTTVRSRRCEFTPLQFFKVRQMSYENSPHHAAFSRSLHREISAVLTSLPPRVSKSPLLSSASFSAEDELGLTSTTSTPNSGRGSLSLEEVPLRRESRRERSQKPSLFGGIMVSQEIAIKVHETGTTSPGLPPGFAHTKPVGRSITTLSKASGGKGSSLSEKSVTSPKRTGSIEMGHVSSPSAAVYGAMASSSGEAADEAEDSTFVDELVAACFERRV